MGDWICSEDLTIKSAFELMCGTQTAVIHVQINSGTGAQFL